MDQTQHHKSVLAHSNEGAHQAAQRLTGGNARPSKLKRGFTLALSAALAASFSSAMPALAYATNITVSDEVVEQAKATLDGTATSSTAYAKQSTIKTKATSTSDLPSKYDLRDPNGDGDTSDSVVTSVKNQAPWGTCWGFSAIAACETSILSEAAKEGRSGELQFQILDLSELQLAWAAYKNGGAPASLVGQDQAGEGYHSNSDNPNQTLDKGGMPGYASNLFASGVGPVQEAYAPYKNKGIYGDSTNNDSVIYCSVTRAGSNETTTENLTQAQIELLESSGATVVKRYYSGNYKDSSGNTVHADWSVDDQIWNFVAYEFENANALPETAIKDENGKFQGVDEDAINAIKSEIHEGRAASVAFFADVSHPNNDTGLAKYISTNTWAHYTYDENETPNHAVTIVGWDDDYSADNFENAAGKKPEGNGAWLVKNSWGSDTEDFPNCQAQRAFGIEDENGNHTGYFWLSYYDRSITLFETYDFDLNNYGDYGSYIIDEYDYMTQAALLAVPDTERASSANVYSALRDMKLRSLATDVARPNSTVTYEIYLLDDDAKNPTDGKKVYETSIDYDYSGYHRLTLDSSDWIAMRKDQRYSVVTTQKCNDDGMYYTCAGMNSGKPTDKSVAKYKTTATTTVLNEYYNNYYNDQFDLYESQGLTEAEAKKKAQEDADSYIKLENTKTAMAAEVEKRVDIYKNSYFEAKVNEGESFSNSANCQSDTGTTGWFDWAYVANDPSMEKGGVAVDNLPIKAYGVIAEEWASVKQLTKIDELLAQAKSTLKNAVISEDGTGVAATKTWITQENYDALKAGVESAEALMKNAGADYKTTLANTTPTMDEASAAIDALNITASKGTVKVANTIKAAKSKIAVKKGKTAKVAIKKARGKVTVTCSNKKVKASYKSGKLVVKGKKKGSVTVKVKAAGNASYKAGSVKVKVTVK